MDNTDNIIKILESNGIYENMFDLIRLVDTEQGKLLEYQQGGKVCETGICCTDVLGSEERCKNCTSSRAYYTNESVVKLEYAGGSVFLIFSVPLEINGNRVVAELVKDISKSMTVNIEDAHRENEITGIIDNLNKMATTDALTGLYNRRYLDDSLPRLVDMSLKLQRPMAVAMLDLDDFKKVNDTHGHAAGDMVLKTVGEIISLNIRRGADWAARYGGEEFFLCFPGAGAKTVYAVLERIRAQVAIHPFLYNDTVIRSSVSIGLAELQPDDSHTTLVERCDALLYRSKANGKDRIEV